MYWFESYCRDDKNLKLEDKTATIIYNCKGFKSEKDPELRALLNYFEDNTVTSDFCSDIDNKVYNVRQSAKFRRDYTDMDLFAYDNRIEGRIEGEQIGRQQEKTEIILEMQKNNFSNEVIANITKLSVEEVKEIISKAPVTK